MRVCIVVPYDLADEGGVKRHAFHLADALRRAGDHVVVAGPWGRGAPPAGVHGFGGVVNVPANGAANPLALPVGPGRAAAMLGRGRFAVVPHHEPLVPVLSWHALVTGGRHAHVATFHMYAESEPAVSRIARRVVGG